MSQSLWSCLPANIEWTENLPTATRYQDVYYSKHDGMAESHEVFVAGNQLPEKFAGLGTGQRFTVAETGFGTGLNFLMCWLCWRQNTTSQSRLFFISCERHPLKKADAERALQAWQGTEIEDLCQCLLAQWPEPVAGTHRLVFDNGSVTLDICHGDAEQVFDRCVDNWHPGIRRHYAQVDAWMLDGFAPAKNPELWHDRLYELMAALSHEKTSVSTFTAAGHVRRGLNAAGFTVSKVAGFGRKRERLQGSFNGDSSNAPAAPKLAWHAPMASEQHDVIIVGAGLAGCHTARALADRGWQVTVIEKDGVAAGSSGNPVAATFTRLSPHANPLSRFAVLSYLYALRILQNHPCFDARGVLQLIQGDKQRKHWLQLQAYSEHQDWFACLNSSRTLEKLGIDSDTNAADDEQATYPSIWFPSAGTVSPARWCEERLDHPNIKLHCGTELSALEDAGDEGKRWRLSSRSGELFYSNNVVLCNAHHSAQLIPELGDSIRGIRGQLSELPEGSTVLGEEAPVICHEGYMIPTLRGSAVIGASYDLDSDRAELKQQDDIDNVQQSETLLAPLGILKQGLNAKPLRAAVRCASRDYLPLVGAMPDLETLSSDFEALRWDAKQAVDAPGRSIAGLYLNLAHGSRGSTSIPLSSEYLASVMHGDPRPIDRDMAETLSPARFLIRQLKRNQ